MTSPNGSLVETIAAARLAHARLCVDTVSVSRIARGAYSTVTHTYATTPTVIYAGYARFKRQAPSDQIVAEGQRQAARAVMVLPYGSTGSGLVLPGDVVTISASVDSELTGKTVNVVGPERGTTTTAHRYVVEEVSP